MRNRSLVAAAGVLAVTAAAHAVDVQKLLADRCFTCHGPDANARQADLRLDGRSDMIARNVLVPGSPERSLIVERLRASDPADRMPPPEHGAALSEAEIEAIEAWIRAGAPELRHWAFVAPVRPEPPIIGSAWTRNPIDAFVLAQMRDRDLEPAPEADRMTLLRRVSLDLTGLPPAPDVADAFRNDTAPNAYERAVDALLDSAHYGERWASTWLDGARYADTKGYEKDDRRTIWPYRDWVIRAFNDDMPFDRFTIEQLAGDLLPDATDDQRLATAFHRNTMTNDEGGTDDEEFRAAAVADRVDTTAQVWMGLTAACARCHTHKYDPITHREYFELYAFFDQTEDADRPNDTPVLTVRTPVETQRLAELDAEIEHTERAIEELHERLGATLPDAPLPLPRPDVVWVDDALPPGAQPHTDGSTTPWAWIDAATNPELADVLDGRRVWTMRAASTAQRYFDTTETPLTVDALDVLEVDVWIDPDDPPRQLVLQFHVGAEPAPWEHRAYWGENLIGWGRDGTVSRRRLGDLPASGGWVTLSVDADVVGLRDDTDLTGWAFSQFGGHVYWDRARVRRPDAQRRAVLTAQAAWERFERNRDVSSLPGKVRLAVTTDADRRSAADRERLARHYRQFVHAGGRARFAALTTYLDEARAARAATLNSGAQVPVMVELPAAKQRTTYIHQRGNFLDRGDVVTPGVPAVFPPLPDDAPSNRLGLARWLVAPEHPLTARVTVNRLWAELFGAGLVRTTEDFGIQGDRPSHPELLDWLATELQREDWHLKPLLRTIVTSATYRQSSAVRDAERDPLNVYLARGPRFRLSAEMIRDQALASSGLLNDTLFGPPVFPPQPDGVWQVVYSGDRWMNATDANRHRRALYTFWRRTSPYPSMVMFDAPSREFCVSRRIRTNTPLQALVTLNDPAFIEAARALAARVRSETAETATDAERVAYAFRCAVVRRPSPQEKATLLELLRDARMHYTADAPAARAFLGDAASGDDAEDIERAAWTVVANVLLNLDEFLTRG